MTPENIGIRIRQLRLERGWKQTDFEDIGLSAQRVSDIETGKIGIGVHTLDKIIRWFLISELEFFDSGVFTNEKYRKELLKEWQLKRPLQIKYKKKPQIREPKWVAAMQSLITAGI